MAIFSATSPDVFSNARVKLYPGTQVLQVANEPIFRAAGWEARTRPYTVPPKGQGKDHLRAMAVSRARARAAVRDIALCNHFTHFLTWTLGAALIDRYDVDEVKRRVTSALKTSVFAKAFAMSLSRNFTRMERFTFMVSALLAVCSCFLPAIPALDNRSTLTGGSPSLICRTGRWAFRPASALMKITSVPVITL